MTGRGYRYVTARQLLDQGLRGPRDGMAAVVVFAGPPTPEQELAAIDAAEEGMRESFAERRIPTPPGGWRLALLHPDEEWRTCVSPAVAADADQRLADAGPDAVAIVVYAFRRSW